jgi:hypothetical protein
MIITHKDYTMPEKGELFVFGSNLAGIHGAGAAKIATHYYGAKWGVGFGKTGKCYAIPTKDAVIQTLSLEEIKVFVEEFAAYTHTSGKQFFITRVGCGLAGYKDKDIAPLFRKCNYEVCNFPVEWLKYLT